jgi:glycerol-3-phosphate dehydrogenase (NAD(P)+)
LAYVLHANGHAVTLWGRPSERLRAFQETGRSEHYLPGIELPQDWRITSDWNEALEAGEVLVVAVPSKGFRSIATAIGGTAKEIISVTKGIEFETGLTMSGILRETNAGAAIAAMSGPTLAYEVVGDMPWAIGAAADDISFAEKVQDMFHRPAFGV